MKNKRKKDDKTYKFIMKYMDKFDLLINQAHKEKDKVTLTLVFML